MCSTSPGDRKGRPCAKHFVTGGIGGFAVESGTSLTKLASAVSLGCDRLFFAAAVYWCHHERGGDRLEVYVDLVVILNFLVDFLLLLGTNRLSGFQAQPGRAALAAALGGLYGGACLLPGSRFLGNLLWRLVCLGLMAVIAFGWNRSALKRGGVFLLLSMALGGLALSFGRGDFPTLVLAAGAVWLLCRTSFGDTVGSREYVPLEITYGGNCLRLTALRDSGNTLRDPITGEQVLVLSADAAGKLLGLTEEQLRSPLETLARRPVPGLRLIPYRAVGTAGGFLLGLRFENVKIGSRRQSVIGAFAPEAIGRGEVYQALAGGAL